MKKLVKLVAAVAALSMIFALPVMANDDKEVKISSESTDQLVQLIDAHNLQLLSALENVSKFASSDAAMADAKIHMSVVYAQIRHEDQDIANNHKVYLQYALNNAQTEANSRKAILDNFTALGQTALIPQAEADYNNALVKLAQAQQNVVLGNEKLAKYYQ